MFDKLFKKKPDNSKELWLKYYDKSNTDEILLQKADDLAQIFPEVVKSDFNGVLSYLEKDKIDLDEKHFKAILKDIYFYDIHMLSRLSQGYLPYAQYDLFMNSFQKALNTHIVQIFNFDNAEELSSFISEYNDFEIEYSKYKPYTPDAKVMAGVLNWEFAKRLSKWLPEEAATMFILVYSAIFIAPTFTYIQIPELLLGRKVREKS